MTLTFDSLRSRIGFWLRLSGRAFARSWGRDVMLYTGGVSFFALLAVFPAIAILIGLYKVGLSISEVSAQATALADVMPAAARSIFLEEISRLTNASARTVSTQSAFALIIGAYAAHRGFKALLAGLNLIHDEAEPHGFLRFNLLAFFVALFAFGLFTVVSKAEVFDRGIYRPRRTVPDEVAAAITDLESRYPGIQERLLDDEGQVRRFVNVYVNEEDIRFLQEKDTPLKDGDEVSIIPAIAGG